MFNKEINKPMHRFSAFLTFAFPIIAYSQWNTIVPFSQNIVVMSPMTSEEITLIKNSDTVWFSDWKRDLKLFGIPNSGLTGTDFSEIDLIDSVKLEEAYNAACDGCPLKWPTTPQAAVELIEMNFLYRGYDNVFKLAASWPDGVKEYRIEATDATVKTTTRDNQIMHTINPKGKTSEVRVIYKDIEGFEHSYGPWIYNVLPLPNPVITTSAISKSSGSRIKVVLPANCSAKSPLYEIISIEVFGVKNGNISGDIIPAYITSSFKVNKTISIAVLCKNPLNGESVVITGSLKVTN